MADILKTLLIDDETNQKRLLSDCVRLIDEEVASKRGISGLAIKAAFKIVRSVKPGFIEEVMQFLLPEFVTHLEPVYDQYQAQDDEKLERFLVRRDQQVADQLLGITDRHANRTKNQGVKVAYEKLRPQAQKHVAAAIPRVAKMLSTYVTE
jgi:hypothetical protein